MEYNVNRFSELLLAENRRHNLVSRRTVNEELQQHITDSLKLQEFVDLRNNKIVDIGSGAGFPGLILAMACQEAKFVLVESDLKKSLFLEQAKTELGLTNVLVYRSRAEEAARQPDFREKFDICTSRAVASVRVMVEYGLPLIRMGGYLFLWKGPGFQQEIDEARNALKMLGGKTTEVYRYSLNGEKERVIIVIKKTQPTSDKYPRRVGIPSKRPL